MISVKGTFQSALLLLVGVVALAGCSTTPESKGEDPFPPPSSAEYDYPFDNTYLATVLGTPEKYRFGGSGVTVLALPGVEDLKKTVSTVCFCYASLRCDT